MTSVPRRPEGDRSPESSEPAARREDALFSNLLASKPARDRRLLPWVVALIFHIPIAYLFFTSSMGERLLERAEFIIRPILTMDDNPPELLESPPIVPLAEPPASAPRAAGPGGRDRRAPGPPLVEPGLPNPNALTNPAVVQETPGGGGTGSILERMTPPPADPRLFRPTDPDGLLSGPDASRARLAARISEYNDSIAAEQLAKQRSTDWTIKDKDGKSWGISPRGIHLGDLTIPLGNSALVPPPGRRDEVNARNRSWAEIESQANRAEIKDDFNERVKEIRKRKDAERVKVAADKNDKKKGGTN